MRFKIRGKLTILFLGVAALPLLLAMLLTIGRIQRVQTEQSVELQAKIAEAAAKEVADFLHLQLGLLDNTGTVYPEFSTDLQTQAVFLERILFSNESFVELAITDSLGREIRRVHRLLFVTSEDYADRATTAEFLEVKENERYIGPLLIESGRPFFLIGKAVRGGRGELRGAILAKVDARIMQEVVSKISAVGKKGRAYIVNTQGTIIGHPDVSQILAERDFSSIPIVRDIISGKSDSLSPTSPYRNELGQEVLGAGRQIRLEFGGKNPGTLEPGWFVVAEEPTSAALAAAIQTARFGWFVFVLVALLAVFISIITANRIVRPIEQVHEASQILAKGTFDHRVNIHTGDEIEDLGKGFNQMAERLSISIRTLEEDKQVISVERNKLSVILSGIVDGIIVLDLDRKIVLANASVERILGKSASEMQRKHVDEIFKIFKDDAQISAAAFCPIRLDGFEGELFEGKDFKVDAAGGKLSYVNLISGQISEGKVAEIGCIITLHDITRERELERVKAEFVSIAAHQLRTPLTEIRWGLSALKERAKLSEDAKNIVEKSFLGTERMTDLVNDLLNVSRVEEGRYMFKSKMANPEEFMSKLVEGHAESIQKKDLNVVLKKLTVPVNIPVDAEMITLALDNILENAILYTPAGGQISIEFEKEGQNLNIKVEDSGIGIPAEHQYRVFSKFFRAPNAVKVRPDGSGLGLFIVKSIVEAHKGKISLQSEEGKGTVVMVSLPISS